MRRCAFTLIEVLLTIGMIVLLFGLLYPDLEKLQAARRLEESCDRLRSLVIMCRSRAMQDGIRYRVQFPGTPDPLDKYAEKEVDVPWETVQPEVYRQDRPLDFPESYAKVEEDWTMEPFLQSGVRCVSVMPGKPNFDVTAGNPIAGPTVTSEARAEFVSLTFNPDGTCDWVTFVLTDLPIDVEVQASHCTRILNLMVDGRTGQTWFQRALRTEEVEVMQEYGASPILHMDFTSGDLITEENILQVHMSQQGIKTAPRETPQPAQ